MNLELTILIVTAFATFFNNALQYYTQVSTYPLFANLKQDAFAPYHKAYEKRLPLSIYAPYTVLMASTLVLALFHPANVGLGWIIALLVLNGSIMAVSLAFAAPVHYRLDREQRYTAADINQLVRFNGLRLAAATASSVIVLYLLLTTIHV